jgi:imidazole glycerol-phosphate synthase subunit HisH
MKLTIINYGAGNIFSVASAFQRLGIEPILSSNEEEINSSDLVVFPGVGHAEAAMQQLKATSLDQLIPNLKQPVLGVCLGMQLMCDSTEEGNTAGLGIFDGVKVLRFDEQLKVPHMGWNDLENTKGTLSGFQDAVYFVHSYYAPLNEYTIAESNYPFAFSAALEKDNFLACQFHPEKSGNAGEEVLKRFFNKSK